MKQDPALYNSRVLSTYLKLLREKYPEVSISEILAYAGIEPYEINDEGCWFTQNQVDLFYEKTVHLTGNKNIAREAGRLAASPGAIGIMRQYVLGLLGPSVAFQSLHRASKRFVRSSTYVSKQKKTNQVEITVTPHKGIKEKLFQCENRMGFFEAVIDGFQLGLPKIEHPECLFQGGSCCRYLVTWKRTLSSRFTSFRNILMAVFAGAIFPAFVLLPTALFYYSLGCCLLSIMGISLVTEILRRKEMSRSMDNLLENSDRLTQLIESSTRNIELVHQIGQALASKKSVEDVLFTVSEIMERGLDFDCGAILLANKERTRLEIRCSFGYSHLEIGSMMSTVFSLDNPNSQGPFVQAFHQQKNFIINNTQEIEEKLSEKSRKFIRELGVHSFLCCPIVIENESLGVVAVTNQTSKRPLIRTDITLLQGIAPAIGVALQNAALIEEQQLSFEKTLKVLADSIDARDYLTAGHSEVVTEYAAGIAEVLGQTDEYIQMIRIAGLLHDYGKIAVPDSILKKNGRLTPEEREIINTHPAKTQQILNQVPFKGVHKQIPVIAGAHHERWDGDGYPLGLKANEIPLGARILAVADFFEAITSKRHYRNPMPLKQAIDLLHESSGSHFDPEVVSAFIEYLEFRDYALVRPSAQDRRYSAQNGSRRRSPRVEYRTQVSVRQGQRIMSGDIINIGAKGAFIASTDQAKEKETLILTFALPGTEEYIQTSAEVCWCNKESNPRNINHPIGFAVRFRNIPPQVQFLISQFVRRQIVPLKTVSTEEKKVINHSE